jgi:acyl-CoA thioesterase-1
MRMLSNYGTNYIRRFAAVYPELAKRNRLPLVPFLLEGVAGVDSLNQPDQIHPTAAGQRLVAETVWRTLEPVLRSVSSSRAGARRLRATGLSRWGESLRSLQAAVSFRVG